MDIYLDTANLDEIRQGVRWGVVRGVTTNPTLMAKENVNRTYKSVVQEICSIVDGPVSAEVVATDLAGMLEEGRDIATWAPNVVVKLPLTPAGLEATAILAREGIAVNNTLCFTPNQALLSALAGASYVSPFVGRLDDISSNGMGLVENIVKIFRNYNFRTKVLAASLRHVEHVYQAALVGADIATMPFKVLQQMIQHPLTDIGLKRFVEDWQKAGVVMR